MIFCNSDYGRLPHPGITVFTLQLCIPLDNGRTVSIGTVSESRR